MQVTNVAAAGARAALVSNNDTTGFFHMEPDTSPTSTSIPSGSLPLSTARPLYNALATGSTLSVQMLSYSLPSGMPPRAIPKILLPFPCIDWHSYVLLLLLMTGPASVAGVSLS